MSVPTFEAENAWMVARSERTGIPLAPPSRHSCASCPWRLKHANEVTEHFALPGTIDRAWAGKDDCDYAPGDTDSLSHGANTGVVVFCHRGIKSDQGAEWENIVDHYQPCSASLAVQQRECIRWHEDRLSSSIDKGAAIRVAMRMGIPSRVFLSGLLTRDDLLSRSHPEIANTAVGLPSLPPVETGEFEMSGPLPTHEVDTGREIDDYERAAWHDVPGFHVVGESVIRVDVTRAEAARLWVLGNS